MAQALPGLLVSVLLLLSLSSSSTALPAQLRRAPASSPILSPRQAGQKRITLGFTQEAVESRFGASFKGRARRNRLLEEHLVHARSIDNEKRQSNDQVAPLYNLEDARYITHITLGGQEMQLILDSGSTDTFVYSVQPYNQNNGSPPPLFDNSSASPLYNLGFSYNASYGSGNGLSNTLGTSLLSNVAFTDTDLAATNLSFADVYRATNGVGASGLLGLGFPLNGNIWSDVVLALYQQTSKAVPSSQVSAYFPVVPLLQAQGQIDTAMFSLVLSRVGPNGGNNPRTSGGTLPTSPQATRSNGSMTIGDFPPGMSESQFTWCEVPVVSISQQYRNYGYPSSTGNRWTTKTEAIFFNGVKLIDSQIQPVAGANYALMDTGNPIMAIASDVLAQMTNAWAANPDNYVIPCDTPFELVFQFGGQNFTVATEDVLVPSSAAIDSYNYGGYATTGCQAQMQPFQPTYNEIGPDTSQTHHLGDVFLRNVISVYQYGNLFDSASTPPRIGLYSTTPQSSA